MATEQLDELLTQRLREDFQLLKEITPTIKAYADVIIDASKRVREIEGRRVTTLKELKEATKDLDKANADAVKEKKAALDNAIREEKLKQQQIKSDREAKKELDEYIKSVKEGQKELDKLAKEREKIARQAEKNAKNAASKQAAREEAQAMRELRDMMKELDKERKISEKQIQQEQKAAKYLENAYNALSAKHKELEAQARHAGAAFGIESKEFQELSEQANALHRQLNGIDVSLGNHRRNVGNYASHWNGLQNSISQLVREIPSLSYGFGTFISAIGNNAPIAADEIQKVVRLNKELAAQGKPTTSALKQILAAALNWQTALIVGITILSTYSDEIVEFIFGTQKATDASYDFAKGLETVNEQLEFNEKIINRNTQLRVSYARAIGASEKEVADIQKTSIKERISLYDEEIAKLIEQEGYYNRLKTQISAGMKFEGINDIKEVDETIKNVSKKLQELNTLRADAYYDLKIQDNQLAENERREFEKSSKTRQNELERAARDRQRLLSEFEETLKELAQKFKNGLSTDFDFQEEIERISRSKGFSFELEVVLKVREDEIAREALRLDSFLNNELAGIHDKQLRNGYRSQEEYQKAITEVTRKYAIERTQLELKSVESSLALLPRQTDEWEKYYNRLSKLQAQLNELQVGEPEKKDNRSSKRRLRDNLEEWQQDLGVFLESISQIIGAAQQLRSELTGLVNDIYDRRIDKLDKERDKIKENEEAEIEAINNQALSAEEKERRIRMAKAKTDAEDKRIMALRRQEEIKQAKFNRGANISDAISKGALAVLQALATLPPPYSYIVAGISSALATAQVARILATPLPSYAEGTLNHKGGKALIGEGGQKELVQEPSGKTWIADRPMVVDLPPRTRVFNEDQLNQLGKSFLVPRIGTAVQGNKEDLNELKNITANGFKRLEIAYRKNKATQTVNVYGIDHYRLQHCQ